MTYDQYIVTITWIGRFNQAIRNMDDEALIKAGIHPALVKAQREALGSQLADLLEEARIYNESQRPPG